MYFAGLRLGSQLVWPAIPKLVAWRDANTGDVDVTGYLHTFVAKAAVEIAIAPGICGSVAEDCAGCQ